jgi:hypothetical protein
MFFTSLVPLAVPSLFHSSVPLVPSSALKESVLPMVVRPRGDEELFGMNGPPPV